MSGTFLLSLSLHEKFGASAKQTGLYILISKIMHDLIKSSVTSLEGEVQLLNAYGWNLISATFVNAITIYIYKNRENLPNPGSFISKDPANNIGDSTLEKPLLQSFSHELRDSLNNIMCALDLAFGENLPSNVKRYLDDAKSTSMMLVYSMNNIFDAGKIESQAIAIDSNTFNLHELIANLWHMFSPLIKSKDLTSGLYISKNVPKLVKSDSYRV
jgi:signal transduction histidine kinase